MAVSLPRVTQRKATTVLGESLNTKLDFGDIRKIAREDIVSLLQQTATEQTRIAVNAGNKVSRVVVDGSEHGTNTNYSNAEGEVIVFFGDYFSKAAMRAIENAVLAEIRATTTTRSGKLSNRSNWQWIYRDTSGRLKKLGGAQNVELTGNAALFFSPKLFYATTVNDRVAKTGIDQGTYKRGKKRGQAKPLRKWGYIRSAISKLRGKSSFRGFNVKAGFTTHYALPDEVRGTSPKRPPSMPKTTVYISITPQARRRGFSSK